MSRSSEEEKNQSKEESISPEIIRKKLRSVIEKELSRNRLSNNHFLVSQMNAQKYVPVAAVLQLDGVKKLTNDPAVLITAIAGSKVCSVDKSGSMIKPNIKLSRNTIILREIPKEATEKEVRRVDVRPLLPPSLLCLHDGPHHALVKVDNASRS